MPDKDSLFTNSLKAALGALLVLTCMAALNPAHATERQALKLLESERNWPIIEITINGQRSQALLDTGATIALIHDDLLPLSNAIDRVPATRVRGIGGNRVLPVTQIESLKAGAQSWNNVRAAVNSAEEFPIGQNIIPVALLNGSIVDFDFRNATVELYDGAPTLIRGTDRNAIKYFKQDGLIFIPVSINGVRGNALIDTGSTVTFINAHFADRAGGLKREQAAEEIRGSDLNRNELRVFEFQKMRLGTKRISKFSIPVLETDLFESLGFEEAPMMVIGMDLLSHYRLQIDRNRKRIVLVR